MTETKFELAALAKIEDLKNKKWLKLTNK